MLCRVVFMEATHMTTAILRNAAREAAESLQWAQAADLYRAAVEIYPSRIGELAEKDIAALLSRAESCERMVNA